MGISQPEAARLFKGNFRKYSVDHIMGFLTAFDRDVEIVVRPCKRTGKRPRLHSGGGITIGSDVPEITRLNFQAILYKDHASNGRPSFP
jgi:hypothetical protein